jgi:hypothetical protein
MARNAARRGLRTNSSASILMDASTFAISLQGPCPAQRVRLHRGPAARGRQRLPRSARFVLTRTGERNESGEAPMPKIRELLNDEIDAFRELRDELRLQRELGKAELRDATRELERRWHRLESRLEAIRKDASGDAEDVREAVRLLARELREGFEHLRSRLS